MSMWESLPKAHRLAAALSAPVPLLLDDEFLESYVSWREETASVKTAYDRWQVGERLAFAAYRAALDREEQAAKALRESAERLSAADG
jgi:hypothetical protein